jgi:hypothetical protein
MSKRKFANKTLADWGIHETEDCPHVVDISRSQRWWCKIVFRAPDDGKLWRIACTVNTDAGYSDIEDESGGLDAVEVETHEVLRTEYRPVS